jgi:dienelactone hydrolase
MAAWGYDVCGLDTKAYLEGFTGGTTPTGTGVSNDLRAVAEWMTQGSGARVALVGWSAGAGLGVLASAEDSGKSAFSGLVVFGLGDEHLTADYLPRVTPLPFYNAGTLRDSTTDFVMSGIGERLNDESIKALSAWLSTLAR